MRLIGYVRVSGKGQVVGGDGLGIQERKLGTWAKAEGHRIVRVIPDEGVSGATEDALRPGLAAALMAIDEGEADGLVCTNLDRFARSLTVQEITLGHVWDKGGKVYTLVDGLVLQDDPDDPQRTMLRQIIGAVAQFERGMVAKRMRDGRAAKRTAGRHAVGPYAYGTRGVGKGRERDAGPDATEQAVVDRMVLMHKGGMSYRDIASALDAEGIKPRRAAAWSAMTVRNIVVRATEPPKEKP